MTHYDYDFFVIGGGSGGVRAGRLAAKMGKRVAIAEEYRYGGTCVIRGCVPKKLYVYASHFSEVFEDSKAYGWEFEAPKFNWATLVAAKEKEITRLEGLYKQGLETNGAEIFNSRAVLTGPNSIKLRDDGREITAEKILIAVGGRPNPVKWLEGAEHCISSNEAFDLPELPNSIIIAGGGYIALEFACIFATLGVKTSVVYRGEEILRGFDSDLRKNLHQEMERLGVRILTQTNLEKVHQNDDGLLDVKLTNGENHQADQVMLALGRVPMTDNLGLDAAGVETDAKGAIVVDEYSRTNVPHILAVGDVTNRVQLTPVAIHEAMCLIETEFKDNPTRSDHDLIPTAVFTQPELGTVGMPEHVAGEKFKNLSVFLAKFRPMKYTLPKRESFQIMKLIVDEDTDIVVGAHICGPEAGEMAQLLGVILKARCTKAHFDQTMALHPSAAEEFVTMYEPSYRLINGTRVEV